MIKMAINWNLTGCEGDSERFWVEDGVDREGKQLYRMRPITEALVFWLCLHTGIPKITADNAGDVLLRLTMCEDVFGAPVGYPDGREGHWTAEIVADHIGLSVNCSPLTRAQFERHYSKRMRERAAERLAQAKLEAEAAQVPA